KGESAMPLAPAEKQPLTTEKLREQLGRLGGTPFKLGALRNELAGEVMWPVSELNRLRREAVAELERQRALPRRWMLNECGMRSAECGVSNERMSQVSPDSGLRAPHLLVLVRNLAQLDVALRCSVETIYCDFENPKKYRDAVAAFRT